MKEKITTDELARIIQKEFAAIHEEIREAKDSSLAKAEFLAFKSEMIGFKKEMTEFKDKSLTAQDEMLTLLRKLDVEQTAIANRLENHEERIEKLSEKTGITG